MKLKILVADDSISIQKLVAMAFYNEDMEVEGISDGVKAFNYLSDFKPDLVMADIYLPGINGFELSTKIKNDPEYQHIRVLLLTSDFEELDEIMYAESKADGYISKPFKTEEIIKKVKSLLGEGTVPGASVPEEDSGEVEIEVESVTEPEEEEEAVVDLGMESLASEPSEEKAVGPKPIELSPEDLVAPEAPDPSPVRGSQPAAVAEPPAEAPAGPQAVQPGPARVADREYRDSWDELERLFRELTRPDCDSGNQEAPETPAVETEVGQRPDLIRETLSYLGEASTPHNGGGNKTATGSPEAEKESGATAETPRAEPVPEVDAMLHERVEKQVTAVLPEQLHGLPQTIVDTVREVVKEVAPSVIRQVIRKEIERIRKSQQA